MFSSTSPTIRECSGITSYMRIAGTTKLFVMICIEKAKKCKEEVWENNLHLLLHKQ